MWRYFEPFAEVEMQKVQKPCDMSLRKWYNTYIEYIK